MSKAKKLFWPVLLCGLILILIIVLIAISNAKNSYLNIYVAPASAKITIDGSEYENGVYRLFPGDYSVKISAEGFNTKDATINLQSGEYTNLFACLTSDGDSQNYYELTANADDLAIVTQISKYDTDAESILNDIESKKAIYEKLPKAFKGDDYYYSIEKRSDCSSILCLSVRNFIGDNYDQAKTEIGNLGFDATRYQIVNIDGAGNSL